MFYLKPPRHISTLPNSEVRTRDREVGLALNSGHCLPGLSGPKSARTRHPGWCSAFGSAFAVTLLAIAIASRMLGSIPITYQLRGEGHPWFSSAQFLVVDLSKQPPRVHWRWVGWDLFTPPGLNRQSRTSSSSWRMTSATRM